MGHTKGLATWVKKNRKRFFYSKTTARVKYLFQKATHNRIRLARQGKKTNQPTKPRKIYLVSVRAHTRAQSSEQRIGHRLNEQVIALEAVKINGASHSSVASNARGSQPSSEFCMPLLSLPLNNFRDEKAVWRSRWGFSRYASLTLLALDNYSFSYVPLFRTFPPIEICSGEPVQGA